VKIFKKHRITTIKQLVLLIIAISTISSILILWLNPALRKGPAGFGPPAKMTNFQASDGSFSISYPENWTVFETPHGSHGDNEVIAVIIVAGRQGANLTMSRQSFPEGNINEVITWGQFRASKLQDYKSNSINPWVGNGEEGYINEYTWAQYNILGNAMFSHCQDTYIYKNNIGYSLSFCASEKDWNDLESYFTEMQNSFSILK